MSGRGGGGMLDEATCEAVIALLDGGGSMQAACLRVGVSAELFEAAARADPELGRRVRRCRVRQANNVLARLYVAAMEGHVPAMSLFLKHVPPGLPGEELSDEPDDDLSGLSRDELEALLLRLTAECERIAGGRPSPPAASE